MAYARTFYFDFESSNGWRYRLEFYDQENSTAYNSNREGLLGKTPVEINYSTDGSGMFAPLKPSTMNIQFVVRNQNDQNYIDQLRSDRTERDVYVYLYRDNVSGLNNPTNQSIWSGYLLMDLSDDRDISFPRVVNLKAVDGIASLKYYDFVPSTTTQLASNKYDLDDTFKATGNNGFPVQRTFIDWIVLALSYGGFPTTSEGAVANSKIKVVNNWYNQDMSASNIDPLDNTRCTANQFYKNTELNGNPKWEAMTCYEAIKHICKSWGMRFTYWRGCYYFIQITSYTANEVGTNLLPNNMRTYRYLMDGTPQATQNNIGEWWTKYQINLAGNYDTIDSGQQRLSGGVYGVIPKLKKITVDFASIEDINLFTSFPLLADPWYTGAAPAGGAREYTIIGSFDNLNSSTEFYLEVWLNFINNSGLTDTTMNINFTMVARLSGTSTWTKQLQISLTQYQPPGSAFVTYVPNWDWVAVTTGQPFFCNGQVSLPAGQSCKKISAAGLTGSYCDHIPADPADIGLTGNIELGFMTYAVWSGSSTLSPQQLASTSHGRTVPYQPPNGPTNDPTSNFVTYSNTIPGTGVGSSLLAPVVNGQIGQTTTSVAIISPGEETAEINIEGVLWGDTNSNLAAGGIQIYDGANWVNTNYSGEWGKDTLGGSSTLAHLLADSVLGLQFENVKKFTTKVALGERGRYYNDGTGNRPNYLTPVSKFLVPAYGTNPETAYIMHTGKFNVAADEWSLNLYEFSTHTTTGSSTTTTNTGGTNTGGVGGGILVPTPDSGVSNFVAPSGRFANPHTPTRQIELLKIASPKALTNINDVYGAAATFTSPVAITSLSVVPLLANDALFSGNLISLRTQLPTADASGLVESNSKFANQYIFELNADYTRGDTSISVVSKNIYSQLLPGDAITIYDEDLIKEYQTKTRGSVAGFDVDADGLTKGGIEITGWLDSDTMTGATANNVPTAESVKAYVDASGGGTTITSASVSPSATQSIGSGGSVGSVTSYVAVDFDTYNIAQTADYNLSGGDLHLLNDGTYQISFSCATESSGVSRNRILAGFHLYRKLSSAASYTAIDGTQGYNYDRGVTSSGGGESYGNIWEGSGAGSCIVIVAGLGDATELIRMGFWIDGRASVNTGITTIPDGIIMNVMKIA